MSSQIKHYFDKVNRIYNYVEGKINQVHPGELRILYTKSNNERFAFVKNHIIYIDISLMIRFGIDDMFILDIICHELSHLDQLIDTERYNTDYDYNKYIESSNMARVKDFILKNAYNIELNTGVIVNPKYFESKFYYIYLSNKDINFVFAKDNLEKFYNIKIRKCTSNKKLDISDYNNIMIYNTENNRLYIKKDGVLETDINIYLYFMYLNRLKNTEMYLELD